MMHLNLLLNHLKGSLLTFSAAFKCVKLLEYHCSEAMWMAIIYANQLLQKKMRREEERKKEKPFEYIQMMIFVCAFR